MSAPTFEALCAAYRGARATAEEVGFEVGAEWDAYEAAEHALVVFPCKTLEEVQAKTRFFLENQPCYDTIRNCAIGAEETLLPFLRSLLGDS